MSERRSPAMPPDVDETVPNAARMYDYFLGGNNNFAADRELAQQVLKLVPAIARGCRQNRAWLGRVVVDMLAAGIRQFVDIGSGVPTMGNVHEIVRANLPAGERATVVYVDYEPVAARHSRIILDRDGVTGWATILQHDLRAPDTILGDPQTTRLIDFTQPVGLLLVAVLHFIGPGDEPDELLAAYRSVLAPGSRLAISHGSVATYDPANVTQGEQTEDMYRDTSNPLWLREKAEIRGFFGDWPLLHYPDLEYVTDWLPDPDVQLTPEDLIARPGLWCGVAEKP